MTVYIQRLRTAADDLQSIRQFARGKTPKAPLLRAHSSKFSAYFRHYPIAVDDPALYLKQRTHSRAAAKAFHDLYESSSDCFSYISEFRENARLKLSCCPYCGMPSNITLDHHLPRKKTAFPEFSTLSLNLVPACSDCQNIKSDYYHEQIRTRRRFARHPRPKAPVQADAPVRRLKCMTGSRRKDRFVLKRGISIMKGSRLIHPLIDKFLMRRAMLVLPTKHPEEFVVKAFSGVRRDDRRNLDFHIHKLRLSSRANSCINRHRQTLLTSLTYGGKVPYGADLQNELMRLYQEAVVRAAGACNAIEPAYLFGLLNNGWMLDDFLSYARSWHRPNMLVEQPVPL